jgi:hypothetical protein
MGEKEQKKKESNINPVSVYPYYFDPILIPYVFFICD